MTTETLNSLFNSHKEEHLFHRYINNESIEPLLKKLPSKFNIEVIGKSVNNAPIYAVTIGYGDKKILMWSQMHGNESTTTKALFDVFNLLKNDVTAKSVLDNCTIKFIPILNPDGAKAYTRLNANDIDLNRDAQSLTQPESKVLRVVFDSFKPHFCFNLHGQRTIFSAGNNNKPATVSFLAPAQDEACTITDNRKRAMEIIAVMNANLQQQIPGQIGIYDDAFNINCVGDTFQTHNVPTVLFEAGHYKNDYSREETRRFIFQSLWVSLVYISNNEIDGKHYQDYLNIPMNQKLFYDIIIRNTPEKNIAIQFEERLVENKVEFIPKIEKICDLSNFYGHKEIDANNHEVLSAIGEKLKEGNENVFVLINNEKFSLIP